MLQPFYIKGKIEAGCDEAGRGCLAGPVYAAAVILPEMPSDELSKVLNDSKKLSAKKRELISGIIKNEAIAWAVASVDNIDIDRINILNASISAMHKSLEKLSPKPELLLIDGNRFKSYFDIPYMCVIKGDATYMSIAAASILAKTERDKYMMYLHEKNPHYNWCKNKGYPTSDHREMIRVHGISNYHRLSFKINKQL